MESETVPASIQDGPRAAADPASVSAPAACAALPPRAGQRLLALIEVILCADLLGLLAIWFLSSAAGWPLNSLLTSSRRLALSQILEGSIVVLTVALILALRRESWTLITGRVRWRTEAMAGIAIVPLLFASTALVGYAFRRFLPHLVTNENPLLALLTTRKDLFWFLLMAILVGGIKEEIQRAFVLRRFEKYLGGLWVGLVVWTAYFGIGHQIQGFDNAVGAAALGLIFGLVFAWRGSMIAPAVSHAIYDTVVVLVTYFSGAGSG